MVNRSLLILLLLRYRQQLRRLKRYSKQRVYTPAILYSSFHFSLDDWSEEECIRYTRFTHAEIRQILPYLELERIKYRNRLQPSSELAFALLCVQLSFPYRLWELSKIFGRSEAYLSIVWTDTIEYLDSRYKRIIRWYPVLQYRRLKRYAKALQRFGGGGHIWGFLDGTFKKHGIKFQGLVTPDGLIASLAGPFVGEVNDNRMVTESRLLAQLRHVFEDREELYLYGDQAYTQLYGIIAPYTGGREAPPHQRAFNKRMSSMRIAVENVFGLT